MFRFLEITDEELNSLVRKTAREKANILSHNLSYSSMQRLKFFLHWSSVSVSSLEVEFLPQSTQLLKIETQKCWEFIQQLAPQYGLEPRLMAVLLVYFEWRSLIRSDSLQAVVARTNNLVQGSTILQPTRTFWQAVASYQFSIERHLPDWLPEFDNPAFFSSSLNR